MWWQLLQNNMPSVGAHAVTEWPLCISGLDYLLNEARKRNLKVSTAFNHMGMWWWHPLQYLVESAQGSFLTRRQLAEYNAT